MNITLYKYEHELNLMDKGSYLTEPLVLQNAILKEATSIVKPILKITGLSNTQLNYNYAYIAEFNRYYFIDNIVATNNNIFELICTVDVLYTYRSQLLQLTAFVSRNEYTFDNQIKDDLLPLKYNKEVTYYDITNLTPVDTLTGNKLVNSHNFLLVCTSRSYGGYNTRKCQPTVDVLNSVNQPVTAYALAVYGDQGYFVGSNTMYEYVKHYILTSESLRSFVKFIIAYPFNLPVRLNSDSTPMLEYISLGDTELSDSDIGTPTKFNILEQTHIKLKIADFIFGSENDANNFLNYEPYSIYEIFIPYYGYAKISAHNLLNKRIVIFYDIDITNGSAIVTIRDGLSVKPIWSAQCQVGVRAALDSSNSYENDTRKQSIALTSSIGFLSASLAFALSGGNPLVMAGSIAGMGSAIGSGIAKSNVIFDTANITVSSGNDGLFLNQTVFIKKTSSIIVDTQSNYSNLIGKPLEKVVNIADLNGYTVIKDIHLSNIKATSTEKEMLLQILKGGFIREQS